jgi:hypothetical protein
MPTLPTPTTLVPAFFLIHADREAADLAASDAALGFNREQRDASHPNAPLLRLMLCEGSVSTVLDPTEGEPHTLEGKTCDTGTSNERELVARYQAFARGLGRELGSACDEIHRDDWSEAQRAWLTDFINEWEVRVEHAAARKAFFVAKDDAAIDAAEARLDTAEARLAALAVPAADPNAITVTFLVSDTLCADTLSCALEGGIGYWAVASEIRREPAPHAAYEGEKHYVRVTLEDAEYDPEDEDSEPGFEPVVVDYTTIRRGIQLALAGGKARKDIVDGIRQAVANDDASTIDADAADVIVQLGALGEIVYG